MKILKTKGPLLVVEMDNIPSSVSTLGYKLNRKSEFHITLIGFNVQRQIRAISDKLFEDVLDYIENAIPESGITFSVIGERSLKKYYPHFDSVEVSRIKEIESDGLIELYKGLIKTFPEVHFDELYPHITSHSLNGRGIAVTKDSVEGDTIMIHHHDMKSFLDTI